MTKVIPLFPLVAEVSATNDTPQHPDRIEDVLARVYPQLVNDVAMLVGKPFRLIWDPTQGTASTDCQAEVRLAPWFFLEGQTEVGFGVTYHEGGHILFSPYGAQIIERARKVGGDTLANIMNIVLDRKDDLLNADYAPGFASRLRRRLLYLCTMTKREWLGVKLEGMSEKDALALLRKLRPDDAYEDFFFAAKWHRRPRFRATHKAMRYLGSRRLLKATPDELLYLAQRVRDILGKMEQTPQARQRRERDLSALVQLVLTIERNHGRKLDPVVGNVLAKLAAQYVFVLRATGLKRLEQTLQALSTVFPGPVSVGTVGAVPVRSVPPSEKYRPDYQTLLASVQEQVRPLLAQLKRIDNPAEFTIYGQDDGELDLSASAQIATGLPGYHQETVIERDIDAEIHLGLDCSGSMTGPKLLQAKQVVTVFSEAMLQLAPAIVGRIWSFNSEEICDFGPVGRQSGFVRLEAGGGNSDTHFLRVVGRELGKSLKRRKLLLLLCDDGPDDLTEAARLSRQLMARGLIVVHLLVGVHGTPDVYPIELVYTSLDECLREFGEVIGTIVKNLR